MKIKKIKSEKMKIKIMKKMKIMHMDVLTLLRFDLKKIKLKF